ncbi:MAG: hypothetical protein AAF687_04065 [Pseudomonadota bacterium]
MRPFFFALPPQRFSASSITRPDYAPAQLEKFSMRTGAIYGLGAALLLAGCSSADPFASGRSVFYNPYAALELANGPVGPECDERVIGDRECYLDSAGNPVYGRFARDQNGNIVRLTRDQRRIVSERIEATQARADVLESLENGTPLPPDSPALRENQSRPAPLPRDD